MEFVSPLGSMFNIDLIIATERKKKRSTDTYQHQLDKFYLPDVPTHVLVSSSEREMVLHTTAKCLLHKLLHKPYLTPL